jgi:hypothetical protein
MILAACAAAVLAPTAAFGIGPPPPPLPTTTTVPLPPLPVPPPPLTTSPPPPPPPDPTQVVTSVVSSVTGATSSATSATPTTTTTSSRSSGSGSGSTQTSPASMGTTADASGSSSASSGSGSNVGGRSHVGAHPATIGFALAGHPVAKLRATRPWVRRGRSRRSGAKVVFRLRTPGRVRFVIMQVAPVCRRVGRFSVRGHVGLNSVLFRGESGGRPLPLGTYWLGATVSGRPVLGATIVVAASRPTPQQLARAQARNVCRSAFGQATIVQPPLAARGPVGAPARRAKSKAGTTTDPNTTFSRNNVLGAHFGKPESIVDSRAASVLALAVVAIMLLGLATLPATALAGVTIAEFVERRRTELALAGTSALLAAALLYLFTGG